MKTALFYAISREPEAARKIMLDLSDLFNLDEKQRKACMLGLLEIADDTMTRKQRRDVVERIAKADEIDPLIALSSFQILQFFLDKLYDDDYKDATTADLAKDILVCFEQVEVEIDENKDVPLFVEILEYLRSDEILLQYKKIADKKEATSGVLPSVRSFGTTVELRAVIGNPFRIGMNVDEEEYDPDIKAVVPVVSIKLRADSGVVDEFSFQASEAELEALIQELRSAQISLKKLQKFVTVSNSSSVDGEKGCNK